MILHMTHTAHLITTARRAAVVAATGAAALSFAALSAGGASAAPGQNLSDNDCMRFSQDSGTSWVLQDDVVFDNSIKPIPGEFAKQSSFQVKNICDTPAKFQVLTAFWKVGGSATAQIRADIAGKTGSPVSITGGSTSADDAKSVAESGRLTKDKAITVNLFIGLPRNETAQGFEITPGWGLFLNEVEPDAPTDPTDPGDPGDTGDTGGSLDSVFGSLGGGSSEGSLGKASASQFVSGATVVANG